jgi:subtilisin family serine protease
MSFILSVDYPDLAYTGSSSYMKISGTSIASGVVAGAAAVLLQANPGLTPGLVKAILQYTAQPLSNANVAQQGAGLLNLDAAVKLAKALKTNASNLTPPAAYVRSKPLPRVSINIGVPIHSQVSWLTGPIQKSWSHPPPPVNPSHDLFGKAPVL